MNTTLSLYTWLLISHIYRVHKEKPVSFVTLRQLAWFFFFFCSFLCVCFVFTLTRSNRYTNSASEISKALRRSRKHKGQKRKLAGGAKDQYMNSSVDEAPLFEWNSLQNPVSSCWVCHKGRTHRRAPSQSRLSHHRRMEREEKTKQNNKTKNKKHEGVQCCSSA